MRALIFSLLLLQCLNGWSQVNDSIKNNKLDDVVISSYIEKPIRLSSLNISTTKIDTINKYGSYNLTELISKNPGVTMLSTGIGITKPVIRGLYGNRILVLLSGLKFDNQQWQEEHGLGLTSIGLSKVELIKGPIGILYGTEALGGVINLVEEEKPAINTKQYDYGFNINSNTLGGNLQAGYKESKGNKWWRIRFGLDNNADYSDGNNNRVLNSRFDGYYLKTTYGFKRKNWESVTNFSSSFNRFGFIFNDVYTFIEPDNRWSRKLNENPSHLVLLNILSSENKFHLSDKNNLTVNFGVQSNKRMENEGGGAISLNMHLLTVQYLARFEHRLNQKNKFIISNLGSFEDNTNYGARKIVPDAFMGESNLSLYLESTLNSKLTLENGIGIGEKWIKTFFTASVNGQGKEIQPFNKNSTYYNIFSGMSYLLNEHLNIKTNLSTGVRVANLAELSSDGLHEGTFTFEIGNPNLKNEQLFSANTFITYTTNSVDFSVSPFVNYFKNYIYLNPTTEQWFGFPVYRYQQQNTLQYGTEATGSYKINTNIECQLTYSGMISKNEDGEYTPYTPAQKLVPQVNYNFIIGKKHLQLYSNLEYNFAQNKIAPNELRTPNYTIWNAGVSTKIKNCHIALSANNILNTAYYDHLSRFKNFGLLNIGRNINLNCNFAL